MLIVGDSFACVGEGEGLPLVLLSWPLRACARCRVIRFVFVNRWGSTRCVECDRKEVNATSE